MVGQLGAAELAAVSLGNSFFFVAFAVGIGISAAITPLIAEADGSGKKLNVKKKIIGCYYPVNYELNTIELIKKLIKNNYLVGLPVIKKNYHMDFYEYRTNDPLNVSRYGIPEPIKQKKLVPTILVIPMVAFDKNCNRLGYGGGYYDRFLEKNQNINLIKIGLAFSFQKVNQLPVNKFDKKLDYIFTEKKIYK